MKRAGILLVFSLATIAIPCLGQCRFASGGSGPVLTYVFEAAATDTSDVLHVTLKFRGGRTPQEDIEVPSEWAGEALHGVVNLRALSTDTVLVDTASRGSKTIRHGRGQELILAYDVVKDWSGRFHHPAEFHGAIMPEYIEVNGRNALVAPELPPTARVTVHFDWQKLPSAWALATSFGTSTGAESRCQSYSGTWVSVQDALFTAGEFRVHHFKIDGKPAVLAVRGQWTFTDDDAIADIQKSVGVVRDFWHDRNFPYFLVTLKPFDNDSGDEDGSAFTNAYWLYLSRRDSISGQLPVLVHETFHGWDPRRMGLISGEDSIEWFREGFVTYYGYLLAYRAGLIQLPAYIENVNRDLRNPSGSSDGYVQGRLIALWLDRQIRKNTRGRASLDNVMRDMVKGAAQPLTTARILRTADVYLSSGAASELALAVKPGSRIPVAEDALGSCVAGKLQELVTFDLGFDLAASQRTGVVTGVTEGGPAFRAGLRNGQPLSGRLSVHNNEPDKTAIVGVEDAGARRSLEFYPRGKPVEILQYQLEQAQYAANPGGCRIQ